MSDETQRWKEKYLKSIEQQEKLERRWDARLDLLRRGLVRSTLAAEGTDRAVDQCMKEMREVVRTDDMDAGLAALLPRLEKAVLDSEQRRETRVNQTSAALNALVTQLQTLPLPREVSRPLKNFAKQLDSRVSQAREIPLLLSELSGLQGKALSQLETPQNPNVRACCSGCSVTATPMNHHRKSPPRPTRPPVHHLPSQWRRLRLPRRQQKPATSQPQPNQRLWSRQPNPLRSSTHTRSRQLQYRWSPIPSCRSLRPSLNRATPPRPIVPWTLNSPKSPGLYRRVR
jgi:hypothetical protein